MGLDNLTNPSLCIISGKKKKKVPFLPNVLFSYNRLKLSQIIFMKQKASQTENTTF